MNILVTLDFPPLQGGIQRFLHDIVVHRYSTNDIVLVGAKKAKQQQQYKYPCPVIYVSNFMSIVNKKYSILSLFFKLKRIVSVKHTCQTVMCGNVFAACAAFPLRVFFGQPYSVYVYGTELLPLQKKMSIKAALLRNVLARATTIISISDYTTSLVKKILPNACVQKQTPKIAFENYLFAKEGEDKREYGNSKLFQILSVGRLVDHKGHEHLLHAVAALPATITWSLVIAGNGPKLQFLRSMAFRYKIQKKVEFRTTLTDDELSAAYHESSVFVFPSVSQGGTEGFGIVLLEAMAHNVPVIASDIGAVREVLDNGRCGMIVPPKESASLCNAICRFAADPVLCRSYSSAASQWVREKYAWK